MVDHKNTPKGWLGDGTPPEYDLSTHGTRYDHSTAEWLARWCGWVLDGMTYRSGERRGRRASAARRDTCQRVLFEVLAHVETDDSMGGRPFASVSARAIADATGMNPATVEAALRDLLTCSGPDRDRPLHVEWVPRHGDSRHATCYSFVGMGDPPTPRTQGVSRAGAEAPPTRETEGNLGVEARAHQPQESADQPQENADQPQENVHQPQKVEIHQGKYPSLFPLPLALTNTPTLTDEEASEDDLEDDDFSDVSF